MIWPDRTSYRGTPPVFRRKVLIGMRKLKPNSLLSGILLAGFIFVVLWFGFSYVLGISMLFWGHYFQPRWYEIVIATSGGAVPAWFLLRKMARWITSRQVTAPHDGPHRKRSRRLAVAKSVFECGRCKAHGIPARNKSFGSVVSRCYAGRHLYQQPTAARAG